MPNFRDSEVFGHMAAQVFHSQVCVIPSLVNLQGVVVLVCVFAPGNVLW